MWQSWLGICCEVPGTIAIGSGPSDGHPTLLSSYRSELGRILASLYVIYNICDHYNIQEGKATLYCDNKGAIQKSFRAPPQGITPSHPVTTIS
jgi:hypothetical protein